MRAANSTEWFFLATIALRNGDISSTVRSEHVTLPHVPGIYSRMNGFIKLMHIIMQAMVNTEYMTVIRNSAVSSLRHWPLLPKVLLPAEYFFR